jgi:dipeptidyl aminopeptidase/acylaminoacyl peptidase
MIFIVRLCSFLVVIATLAGCAVTATHPSLKAGNGMPDLIPVRDFVANRGSNFNYAISPDGKKLAWIAVKGVTLHIHVKNLESKSILTIPANWYGFVWAQDSRHLLGHFNVNGDENTYVVALDTEQPDNDLNKKVITPFGGVKAQLLRTIVNDPAQILVTHNQRDKTVFDLYRININTNEQILLAENPGNVTQWLSNSFGEFAGRIVKQDSTIWLELSQSTPGAFKPVYQWSSDDLVSVVSVIDHGATVYLLSNKGRDRLELIELATESGDERVVYADPVADISQVFTHPITDKPLLVISNPDFPKAVLLDQSFSSAFSFFNNTEPANIAIASSDNLLQRLTILLNTDKGYEYLLYDMVTHSSERLGAMPLLEQKDLLADISPIEITSRDKVPLRGYLSLPKGVPAQRLPMVLLVHGGPWDRDHWAYNSEVQFLANRGYAVLQLNYRGSSGYGRHFQELAIGEFAGKMHDDLLDGVNWAIDTGIADPAKIAIVGTSYGGYAALVGLSFTPDVFACGIDINGMSDLVRLTKNYPPYWKLEMYRWYKYVGDPRIEADRAVMLARSPLPKVASINKPLLVIQGRDDVRVQKEQSIELVNKMVQANKEVDFWLIPGTGHGLMHWPVRLKQFRKTEDFLADCLGGRSSGFDFYQLGAWLF